MERHSECAFLWQLLLSASAPHHTIHLFPTSCTSTCSQSLRSCCCCCCQGAPPEITGFGAAPPHSFDSNTTQPITLFPPATHPHSQRPSGPQQQPITLFPPAAHPHSQRPSEPQQQSITLFPPTARPHSQLPVGSQQQPLPPVPAPALPSPYPAIDRMLLRKQRVLEAARGARAGRPRSEAAAAPPRPHLPQPPVLVPREGVGGQGCTEGGGTEGGGGGGTRGAHSHRPAALEEHTHRLTMSRVPQGPGCAHMPRPNVHALHAAEAYAALACWRERRAVAAVRIQAAVRGHLCRWGARAWRVHVHVGPHGACARMCVSEI